MKQRDSGQTPDAALSRWLGGFGVNALAAAEMLISLIYVSNTQTERSVCSF